MKPGSSERCTSRSGGYHCRRRRDHDGPHQARRGTALIQWPTPPVAGETAGEPPR
jgi:hypothetical protein